MITKYTPGGRRSSHLTQGRKLSSRHQIPRLFQYFPGGIDVY